MVGLESEENEKGSTTAGHEKQENGEGQLSRAVIIIRYTPGISDKCTRDNICIVYIQTHYCTNAK